jgi:hypothetical protein
MSEPRCVDCVYHRIELDVSHCGAPTEVDARVGRVNWRHKFCLAERDYGGSCGPSGSKFKPAPQQSPPSLWKWRK